MDRRIAVPKQALGRINTEPPGVPGVSETDPELAVALPSEYRGACDRPLDARLSVAVQLAGGFGAETVWAVRNIEPVDDNVGKRRSVSSSGVRRREDRSLKDL